MMPRVNSSSSVKRRDSEKKSKVLEKPKKLSEVNMMNSKLLLTRQRYTRILPRKHTMHSISNRKHVQPMIRIAVMHLFHKWQPLKLPMKRKK
jgi:hypothetical protein